MMMKVAQEGWIDFKKLLANPRPPCQQLPQSFAARRLYITLGGFKCMRKQSIEYQGWVMEDDEYGSTILWGETRRSKACVHNTTTPKPWVDDNGGDDLLVYVRFGAIPIHTWVSLNWWRKCSCCIGSLSVVRRLRIFLRWKRKLAILLPSCFLFTPPSPLSLLPRSPPELMHPPVYIHFVRPYSGILPRFIVCIIQISLEAMWMIVLNRHMVSWSCSLLAFWSTIQGHIHLVVSSFLSL